VFSIPLLPQQDWNKTCFWFCKNTFSLLNEDFILSA
jgi:hypothetical protein